jgi:hypothetical protein
LIAKWEKQKEQEFSKDLKVTPETIHSSKEILGTAN